MFFSSEQKFDLDMPADLRALITKWKPRSCKSEKDYENSLYEFLHKELGDTQITKQYARGRIRADVVIAEKVIVEMKTNLDSTGKYQRLVGQLTAYEKWEGFVVVLLTGDTDKNLLKELATHIKELNEKVTPSFGFFVQEDAKFLLVEK